MAWLNIIGIPLLARLCLVILFPFSTLDKIFNYKNAVAQANATFIPGGPILLVIGGLIEVLGSLCIVIAWHDRLAAFLLAGYCVVTAILFHNFWSYPDFWTTSADSKARSHFWDFLKNFSLAGGLILLVLMSHMIPASSFIVQPLSSVPIAAQP